jgi:FkbM family methyltransferase
MWRLNLTDRAIRYRFRERSLVCNTVWGFPLEVHANDIIGNCVYFFGSFHWNLTSTLATLTRPGDIVIDVGANVGFMTLFFASLVGPQGSVYAVEPFNPNLALLERNVSRAGYRNRVRLEKYALGDHSAIETLRYQSSSCNLGGVSLLSGKGDQEQSVEMVPLDSLWEKWGKPRASLLKVDVEGFELNVLAGAQQMFAEAPPKVCLVEFNTEYLSEAGARDLWQFFCSRGYEPCDHRLRRLSHHPAEDTDIFFLLPRKQKS